jgi:ATP-binding cassette subfamily B protein
MMNDPPVHLMWMASSYEPDQPKRDRKFNWHRFLGLLRGYRIRIVALMLCTLVNACLGVAPPILAKAIIDGPLSTHDARMLLLDVAYMVLVAIAGSLLFVLQGYLNASICEGIIRDVRTTLITQLMRMPISFFSSTRTGQLMNRVSNDIGSAYFQQLLVCLR